MPVLAPKAVGQRRRRRWRRWLPQDGEPLADAAETRGLVLDETEKGAPGRAAEAPIGGCCNGDREQGPTGGCIGGRGPGSAVPRRAAG